MRTLLIQHECEAALEVLPEDMEDEAKAELNKKAHSAVILCLSNKVLREVTVIDVVVPVESIRAISERFANTAYGFFLGKLVAYPVVANYVRNTWDAMLENGPWFIRNNLLILKKWYLNKNLLKEDGRSSYARVMIEFRADVELKDNIVVAMPKITGEGHYICNVHVKYEWKPLICASCKVFRHILEECPKNIGVGEKKTLKNPCQTSQGVPVGPKMGTNGGTTNLVNNEVSSSGSSFMNVNNSSTNTTPMIDKIRKFEELLISGKATLVDEAGNPLKKVEFLDDYDSEDEVASVDNDMARSVDSERVGFGTQSLLEQWRYSYGNGDYDEDPYDDHMYKGQGLPQEL
ncbi:retrotransposon protein, putative, ty1-copia subclass [Tanacetum coccineum]